MSYRNHLAWIFILFLLSFVAATLKTGSPWPAFGRNIYHTNYSPFRTNTSQAGVLQWSYAAGYVIESTPSIDSDGVIYMGSDQGMLHAIDPITHTAKWIYTAPKSAGVTQYYIESTPVITDDGFIYFGCYDSYLYSLSAYSGSLQWRFKTANLVYASPTIDSNGYIYFGSFDSNFYCLSSSGSQIWKYSTSGLIYSTATLSHPATGMVYFVSSAPDYQFYALNTLTGEVKFTVNLGYDGSESISSATVDGADTVYIGSNDGYLYRIYTDGSYKRLFKGSSYPIFGTPTLSKDGGTIFYGSYDKYVYAISITNNTTVGSKYGGTLKWKYKTNSIIQNSAVIDADGLVIIGSTAGDNYAFDQDTGAVVWKFTTPTISGANSASIGADGMVYFSSYDYHLYAVGGGGVAVCGAGEGLGANFTSTTTTTRSTTSKSMNSGNRSICSMCGIGTYSYDHSYCIYCPLGYFQNIEGGSNCTACPTGYISASTGATNCSACSAGTYNPSEGSSSCSLCSKGYYSSVSGSSYCTPCAAGSYTNSLGSTSCTLCPVGRYSPTSNSSSCVGCPVGTYTNTKGSSRCTLCAAGHYTSHNNSTKCSLCRAGFYASGRGASVCTACPEGMVSNGGVKQCTACAWPLYNVGKGNQDCDNRRLLPYLAGIEIKAAVTVFLFSFALFAVGIMCVGPYRSHRRAGLLVTRFGMAIFLSPPFIATLSSLMYFMVVTFKSYGIFAIMWIIIMMGPFLCYLFILRRVLRQPHCRVVWWTFPASFLLFFIAGPFLMESRILFISPVWNTWSRLYTGTRDFEANERGLNIKYFNRADLASTVFVTLPLLIVQIVNSSQMKSWGYVPVLSIVFSCWSLVLCFWRYNSACFEHVPVIDVAVQLYVMDVRVLDLAGDGMPDNAVAVAYPFDDIIPEQQEGEGDVVPPVVHVLVGGGEMIYQAEVEIVHHHATADLDHILPLPMADDDTGAGNAAPADENGDAVSRVCVTGEAGEAGEMATALTLSSSSGNHTGNDGHAAVAALLTDERV